MKKTDHIAQCLISDRSERKPFRNFGISDEVQSYKIQDIISEDVTRSRDVKAVGYKIGLTNPESQAMLSSVSPVWGRIFSDGVFNGSAPLSGVQTPIVEVELCFKVGAPHEEMPSISAAYIAIEIVDNRQADQEAHVLSMIADNAWGHSVILGPQIPLDLAGQSLAAKAMVGGSVKVEADSSLVMGSPLNAFKWLNETLRQSGRLGLQEGEIVMTGAILNLGPVNVGDVFDISFDQLADFQIRVEQTQVSVCTD